MWDVISYKSKYIISLSNNNSFVFRPQPPKGAIAVRGL